MRNIYTSHNCENHFNLDKDIQPIIDKFEEEIVSVRKLNRLLDDEFDYKKTQFTRRHHAVQISRDTNYHDNSIIFMLWLIVANMKELFPGEGKSINKIMLMPCCSIHRWKEFYKN